MDFFESQHRARRRTGRLLLLYIVAVACMIAAIYFVALFAGDYAGLDLKREHLLWHPDVFLIVAGSTSALIFLGSLYRILHLRSGGSSVAYMLGGRRVDPATVDPDERKLVNVVEEMAIASGVPVPEIFVLDRENGINAFAAGYTPSDAAVAVTKACMQQLTRDELQGVIAHEFSHILNGDMRLNIRLIGVLNGILLIHLIGFMILRSMRFTAVAASSGRRSRNDREGGGAGGIIFFIIVLAVALMIIGYVGVFFSRIIQAAVSRQREYLADAAAVQFTRNPDGISGALKKIGGSVLGSRIMDGHAVEASHLFFANGLTSSFTNIFSTHPPLAKRIKAIDPSFDGKSWIIPKKRPRPAHEKSASKPPPIPSGAFQPLTQSLPIEAAALLATIGTLDSQKIARAETLIGQIPAKLKEAVRTAAGAEAVVYSLILSTDPELTERQLQIIREHSLDAVAREVVQLSQHVQQLPPELRLPLADLAMPALRQISPAQFKIFRQAVHQLIASDQELTLFEFALEKVIVRHLERYFQQGKRPATQYYAAAGLVPEFSLLLSALAHVGDKNAPQAFASAAHRLPGIGDQIRFYPFSECTLDRIAQALAKLETASFPVKKQLLAAATAVIIHDGQVDPAEAELLRAIADTLDCPLPPLG